jgi:dihydrofolate synthase/folylpolyglutamate synthase
MPGSLAEWLAVLESRHPIDIDMGLDRSATVYQVMGSPRPAPMVFTVAGTNGKGSVVAYLSAMLAALGKRCGTYTSPHLVRFNERVTVDGLSPGDREFMDAFEYVESARRYVSLTYFEFTTLAAFKLLHDAALDVVVLEVGLGGRLDTVNLVDPDCAVITNIDLDHQEYLGRDRETIGFEKAGIMRAGVPVVIGEDNPPESVAKQASLLGAPMFLCGRDFTFQAENGHLMILADGHRYSVRQPAMQGEHQNSNLATAVSALHVTLKEELTETDEWSAVASQTRLAGRLEPGSYPINVIFDVGHNPLAARIVAGYLSRLDSRPVTCVLGMLKDKDCTGVARELLDQVDHWICTGLSGSRGQGGADLAATLESLVEPDRISVNETMESAIDAAIKRAGREGLILVFGSFHTVALAREVLDDRNFKGS